MLQQRGYGVCQLVLTVAAIPVTIYVIRMNVLDLREQARDDIVKFAQHDEKMVVNPLTTNDDDNDDDDDDENDDNDDATED